MKIALVHDYLSEAGGAERVLSVLSDMYPEAPIYTAFAKRGTAVQLLETRNKNIVESRWGWFLKQGRLYSTLRFLLPWIWKSIDLTAYDLIITSCSGYIARGFRVRDDARVIAYCHTPPRWLYGYETPTAAQRTWWGRLYLWVVGPWVRVFDYQSAARVDTWIANSQEVARRIKKFYRQEAIVVYPPVTINYKSQITNDKQEPRDNYFLTVARLVGGKGLVEAAAACASFGRTLKVVGEGLNRQLVTELRRFQPYVELSGRVSDAELATLYAGAQAFIALAKDEDFGMTLVEAMQCGTPVIAYRGGGYRETVREKSQISNSKSKTERVATGVFVDDTKVATIARAIARVERTQWDHTAIAQWGRTFGRARFEREMKKIIETRT
jgi:glycosyltransferase involved in cell wall biosynthesis